MAASARVSMRGFRAFCMAARHGSFRVAAEELFITASAVSHQIKNLEDALGEQLFERNGRELKLSPRGEMLYAEVNPLIEQLDAVVANFRQEAVRRSIRISVQPFFASEYFIPRLREFTAANPEIDIKVGTSDESAEKHPADADMSIRLFRAPPPELQADVLFPLQLAPAASPGFKRGVVVKEGRITSEFSVIAHETYPNAWKQWSEAAGIELPERLKVTRLDSMIAVVRAAQQGLGAALVPIPVGDLWFKEGGIVRLFDPVLVAPVSYYLVCSNERAEDPEVVRFRNWILRNFVSDT